MPSKMIHQICCSFYWTVKKWSKSGLKYFFGFILRVFLFTVFYTQWDPPQDFAKWKSLLRYISVINFTCGCEIKNFQSFFYWFSTDEMAPFWDIFGPFGANIAWFAKNLTRSRLQQGKHSVWKMLRNIEFWFKWNVPKVYSFRPFWCWIYCWKTKNIAKNQNFCIKRILRNN